MNALAKSKRAARRINTPAESKGGVANECAGQNSDGGAARGCAGEKMGIGICQPLDRQWWHSEGMRQPNGATPNRWGGGECAGKRRDQIGGECGGGSAGDAPAKRNNTKSVAARRGMRRLNEITPNRQISGECAGQMKEDAVGDEMRRPSSKTKSVGQRRMRRQTKENVARR